MNSLLPITIMGGGLAGLTLGIALRKRGVPVELREAGHYPRHRVCGEFISGRGQDSLERLGLMPLVRSGEAHMARTAAFFSDNRSTPVKALPRAALCISRYALDALLAGEFLRLGGVLKCGVRGQEEAGREGMVRATGRRARGRVEGWRWLGLKAEARGVELSADLEMHLLPHGYVGLCRLPGGAVNVCGLFRVRERIPEMPHLRPEFLRGEAGGTLRARLEGAKFDPTSFCSVAGLDYMRPPRVADDLRVGDSWSLIPPVTGNGMSMAFESAELAAPVIDNYSRGRIIWSQACREVERNCRERFARRLRCAGMLQRWLFRPAGRVGLLWLASRGDKYWRLFFALTR